MAAGQDGVNVDRPGQATRPGTSGGVTPDGTPWNAHNKNRRELLSEGNIMHIRTMLIRAAMAIALGGTLAVSGFVVANGMQHILPIAETCPTCVIGG